MTPFGLAQSSTDWPLAAAATASRMSQRPSARLDRRQSRRRVDDDGRDVAAAVRRVAGPGAVQARIAAVGRRRAGVAAATGEGGRQRQPGEDRRGAGARRRSRRPSEIDHAGRVKKRRVRLAVAGAELAVAVVAPAAHVLRVQDSARVRAPGGDAAQRAPAALRRLGQEVARSRSGRRRTRARAIGAPSCMARLSPQHFACAVSSNAHANAPPTASARRARAPSPARRRRPAARCAPRHHQGRAGRRRWRPST